MFHQHFSNHFLQILILKSFEVIRECGHPGNLMIVIMRWKRSLVHTYIVASGCLVNRCPSNAWACWDTFLHCALLSYAEHASDLSSNGSMETALGEYKSLQRFFLRIATLTIFKIDLSNSIKDRLKPHPCLEVLVLITSLKKSSRNWGSLLISV